MKQSTVIKTLLAGVIVISVSASVSMAEKPPAASGSVAQGPYFNPKTNSYFELKLFVRHGGNNWNRANQLASRQKHKGQQGRLATVKDTETLDFIRGKFRINNATWIGLRFFCKFRKLVWVTREIQPRSNYGMWAPSWHRFGDECVTRRDKYMGVFLTKESEGLQLQAVGSGKNFYTYLVEYPASRKEESPDSEPKKMSENK